MTSFRALMLRHRAMALMLVMAALCMKALIPTGYMVEQGAKTLTIELCSDGLNETVTRQIAIPMKSDADGRSGDHGAADSDCAYSSLQMASLGGDEPAWIADALVFIMATGFAPPATPAILATSDLRPPLRGPPAGLLTI